jgi:hypothetical protein
MRKHPVNTSGFIGENEGVMAVGTILPDVDELLRAAIEQKRLVSFVYKDSPRVIEPHDYGIQNGSVKVLGYQVGGSSSGPLPNWRWFEVNLISDIRLLTDHFAGGRPGSGKHHQWSHLFRRVAPHEEAKD